MVQGMCGSTAKIALSTPHWVHTWVHRGKRQKIKWCPYLGGILWTVVAMEGLYFFSQTDPKFSEEPLLLFIINPLVT